MADLDVHVSSYTRAHHCVLPPRPTYVQSNVSSVNDEGCLFISPATVPDTCPPHCTAVSGTYTAQLQYTITQN